MEETAYHWFEEPEDAIISLKKEYQIGLIKKALREERLSGGSTKTLAKKLGVHIRTIFRWQSHETKGMYIKHLVRICDYLDLSYITLENESAISSIGLIARKKRIKSILNPKLPFNFASKIGAELVGYGMSDGCVSSDYYFIYASDDPNQVKRVDFLINKICGKVEGRVIEKGNCVVITFSPTIGRMLNNAGVSTGSKTKSNPCIPNWVKYTGPQQYLRAVFTDEGHSRLRVIKTQRHKYWSLLLNITHGRSREISSELNEDFQKTLSQTIEPGKAVPLKYLPQNIASLIRKIEPPKLLLEEKKLLARMKIKCGNIRPMKVHRSKNNLYSCYWRFQILKQSVKDFFEKIGFSPKSEKQKRLRTQIKIFTRFWKTSLTDNDLKKYKLYFR